MEGDKKSLDNLAKIDSIRFYDSLLDIYNNYKGEFFVTREQLGRALGYNNPNDGINRIHIRNKSKLDKCIITINVNEMDDIKKNITFYSESGFNEICRLSRKPKAIELFELGNEAVHG